MTQRGTAVRTDGSSSLASAELTGSRSLRIGGWSATGAGFAGLAGLISTVPWPQLFSLDAVPATAVFVDPGLLIVLVGHYGILASGGALGLLAGVMLAFGLRRHPWSVAAALLVGAGSAVMGYAAARRAIDVTMHAGRSTVELSTLVWAGGGLVLLGTLLLTLALRRRGGKLFLILGLSSPVLVSAGTTIFLVLGPEAIPVIWGVTFPPPPDYLLAVWFIVLGWLARTGRLQGGVGVETIVPRS
jgi:hypothetical protein